jgi:hypothetical protein
MKISELVSRQGLTEFRFYHSLIPSTNKAVFEWPVSVGKNGNRCVQGTDHEFAFPLIPLHCLF